MVQDPNDFYLKKEQAQARMDELDEVFKEASRRTMSTSQKWTQRIVGAVMIWFTLLLVIWLTVIFWRAVT